MAELKLNAEEIGHYLAEVFPQLFPVEAQGAMAGGGIPAFVIESLSDGEATLAFTAAEEHLRPGGTVSGPALMTLADLAMYVLVLAHIGRQSLAVTTNLNINFLRKPEPGRLLAKARLLKLGRALAVGDVVISAEAAPGVAVAHATLTYSIPPK